MAFSRFCQLFFTVVFCFFFRFSGFCQKSSKNDSIDLNGNARTSLAFDLENEAIVSHLDSLVSLRFFKTDNQGFSRVTNKFGFRPDSIPRLSDSLIFVRMRQIQSPIPFKYNSIVKDFIHMYAVRKKPLMDRVMSLSLYYYPLFEAFLDKYNLPLQLKHLAIVESALNPSAVSRVGASGLWQFMYRTGLQYGLKVNYYLDERRDPVAATDAACRYLADLHHIYNDWLLALAAYNCGPGNINKAIRRSGGKTTFWEIMPFLPRETRGYVPAFIAVSYLMTYSAEHNIYPFAPISIPYDTDTITVQGPLPLQYFSKLIGLDSETLIFLNPQLKHQFVPPVYPETRIRIPAKLVPEFERKRSQYFSHLLSLSKSREDINRANVALMALAKNSSDTSNQEPFGRNFVGQKYFLHKVKRGETLIKISLKYNVSVEMIKEWNGMHSTKLMVGQSLKVNKLGIKNSNFAENLSTLDDKSLESSSQIDKPKSKSQSLTNSDSGRDSTAPQTQLLVSDKKIPNSLSGEFKIYRVKKGESLWTISKKFNGVTIVDILRCNQLTIDSKLQPGMILKIQSR